ncbi:nibrin [Episyrphus balteatus]|uniref:nibrin n=1 Tax=Episyrphus balteatus TaxID=286459 RepID=UPI002485B2BC|nr:nibrin [Episyrphus balteatus]
MWVITHINSGNKIYLLTGKQYTVGRVGSDIVLTDDTSISRSHALFQVTNDFLKLQDKGSKYGTYHNEHIENKQKLTKGNLIDLKEGDRILFGALKNEWLISKNSINTMVSSLNPKDLVEIKKQLDLLGGNIISKWESKCTHLTMPEITITIKVLHALIEKIPIVSCSFWKEYLKNIQEKKKPPNPSGFMPKRSNQLSSAIQDEHLGFNENRKTLFAGKTFVFMTKKHFDMYSEIVTKAGGQCKDLKNNVSKAFLVKKNTIVVQYVASTQSQGTQTINTISEYIESKSLRTIPEYEIGLAIVCCTIEKYCNPAYSTISNILPDSAVESPNIGTMLAENTASQKSQLNSLYFPNSDIPESNCLKSKVGPNKTIQSEVYDSEVVIVESQNSSDRLSMIPESDISKRSKQTIQEISQKEVQNLRNIDFSDDDFSENLVMSSDMVSNEILSSKENSQSNETRKRPTTPIETDGVSSKKPRISTPIGDENQEESDNQKKPIERPLVSTSKRNVPQSTRPSLLPGFLQKSQIVNTQPEVVAQSSQQPVNKSVSAKRGRIALITDNDSDDDDDDIFNFGSSPKKSKPSAGGGCISDEDELFAFGNKSPTRQVDNRVERNEDATLPKTQPFIPNNNKKTPNANNVSKIKVSPIKPSSDGWLSALNILKIKSDDEVKEEKEEKNCSIDDLKRKEWIDSLKDGIEVRVRKMNITSKASSYSISHETSDTSLNTSRKNFKAFVKKHNYKTQTHIIPTFPKMVPPT